MCLISIWWDCKLEWRDKWKRFFQLPEETEQLISTKLSLHDNQSVDFRTNAYQIFTVPTSCRLVSGRFRRHWFRIWCLYFAFFGDFWPLFRFFRPTLPIFFLCFSIFRTLGQVQDFFLSRTATKLLEKKAGFNKMPKVKESNRSLCSKCANEFDWKRTYPDVNLNLLCSNELIYSRLLLQWTH